MAGRPDPAPDAWKRECPLTVVLDNYSVHKSRRVQEEVAQWIEAGVTLFYLPAYSPQISAIEPVWCDAKAHGMPWRAQTTLGDACKAVEEALTKRRNASSKSTTKHITSRLDKLGSFSALNERPPDAA